MTENRVPSSVHQYTVIHSLPILDFGAMLSTRGHPIFLWIIIRWLLVHRQRQNIMHQEHDESKLYYRLNFHGTQTVIIWTSTCMRALYCLGVRRWQTNAARCATGEWRSEKTPIQRNLIFLLSRSRSRVNSALFFLFIRMNFDEGFD